MSPPELTNTSPAILLINKPLGLSSAQIVGQIKRKLDLNKVGHAGTLDPMASGLLVLLINSATKLASFAEKGQKLYTGEILLGQQTSTDDLDGEVISQSTEIPPFDQILAASKNFCGVINQVPPQISAVKVDGKRAYDLARKGQVVELKSRQVTVDSFELKAVTNTVLSFKIRCSAGTYIRSIARDLGQLLGCGGCIKSLCRAASWPFDLSEAKDPAEISLNDLRPWTDLLPDIRKIPVEREQALRLLNGQASEIRTLVINKTLSGTFPRDYAMYVYAHTDQALGLLQYKEGEWGFAVSLASAESLD